MERNANSRISPRWRTIALVAIGVAIGTTLSATPVYSHVGKKLHYLKAHVLPATDKRYFRKADADARFVNVDEKAPDADRLDGRDGAEFFLDGLRAYAYVRHALPDFDAARTKGFVAVTRVPGQTGHYCLTPAPGSDATSRPAVASADFLYSAAYPRWALVAQSYGCASNEFAVITYAGSPPARSNGVTFSVMVP